MSVSFHKRCFALLALALLTACHGQGFVPIKFGSNEALFEASLRELNQRHWDNAVSGFERLTTNLPARDPLLPRAYYYLGKAHEGKKEYLLAAQSFSRVPESFPEDTLAAASTFEAGLAYAKLWRKPALDAEYGETALATLQSFLVAFPDSPLHKRAEQEIQHLEEWFATKNYETGVFYMKRKAYDPAIIYFKDAARQYPATQHARLSLLKLVEAYRKINYREEVAETCGTLRERYPSDRGVIDACGVPTTASTPQP
jgi:outer membrane protein assembly factor BamD